ncbi:hypothetical protein VUJ46_06325 [Chryseobacterium sp. MYb264]|uniref:hypothetical protein n=1 Tax=Chryseobacterium sp. MYb264 TaxID=2745153 RepID=UPI002E115246|nr:hypothetical protein VUJ46_06325 [Chryseobacterium sp. MYb264]
MKGNSGKSVLCLVGSFYFLLFASYFLLHVKEWSMFFVTQVQYDMGMGGGEVENEYEIFLN